MSLRHALSTLWRSSKKRRNKMNWNPYEALRAAPKLPLGDPNRSEDLREKQRNALKQMGDKSLIARPHNEVLRRQGKL